MKKKIILNSINIKLYENSLLNKIHANLKNKLIKHNFHFDSDTCSIYL